MTGDRSVRETPLGRLAEKLGGQLTGDPEKAVRGANGLADAAEDEIAFLANARYERFMAASKAAAVIVAEDYDGPGDSLIRCADPYFSFRQAMVLLYGFRRHPYERLDPTARIDPSARLGEGVAVAQFATISPGVEIGPRSVLYPGVFVGARCRIGADCVLYPNVVLYEGCLLGDRVIIHANSVVGQDGFGYATHAGRHEKIPQAGWVEIADDVEIGACCAIDRATVGATVIGPGTKFSNLVAIGHGARLGGGCLLVAQAGVAGSTKIGDYCALGGQAGVVGHIEIGQGVRIGAQAGVINDVPPGQGVWGSPSMPRNVARRAHALLAQLPTLRDHIRKLQAEVETLKRRAEPGKPK
jgi:UDP-3-O-[3-hydroxymyristoyl] glucosamine N-acyltransferase